MAENKILVVDFGGQYNQLIARRVRQCHIYSEVVPYTVALDVLKDPSVKGIIFTGGPNSVYDATSPKISPEVFTFGKPILGICYGAQLIAQECGGEVRKASSSEYGKTVILRRGNSPLLDGVSKKTEVFMSHTDQVTVLPKGFRCLGSSEHCRNAAFADESRKIYATQFHPEVEHTLQGQTIIENFALHICHCAPSWKSTAFIQRQIAEIRAQVGEKKVLCALSGGVDSSVTAALLSKAIGKNLTCVFVDHGLLRKDEAESVKEVFGPHGKFNLNFISVDASALFLERLKGVEDPETKRKIIGSAFIDVFRDQATKLGSMDFLAQGTIYPDRIESGLGISARIKSHHNVGGLPKDIGFSGLIEPLKNLFKDEVRDVGTKLGLPKALVFRQPFPGPGLGIRIIGEITAEKIHLVQEADAIFRKEIANAHLDKKISQYFAALSNMKSVGVMGDFRTYDYAIVLRAVTTDDFMTAQPYPIPYDVLTRISDRIVNEVRGVNRVLYDFTSKPPSTIEME